MKTFNLSVPAGKYLKDGEEKTRWHNVGIAILRDNGRLAVKLDSIPFPNSDGELWINGFPKEAQRQSGFRDSGDDEDIPF